MKENFKIDWELIMLIIVLAEFMFASVFLWFFDTSNESLSVVQNNFVNGFTKFVSIVFLVSEFVFIIIYLWDCRKK